MAYTKRTWEDRAVQHPRRYEKFEDADGKLTLIPEPGAVYKAGTPLNAANMNAIEQGIADAHETADAALPRTGGEMENNNLVVNLNADLLDGKQGSEYAGKQHTHGNIANDGKIGTTPDLILGTGAGGSIITKTPSEVNALVGMSNPNILHNWDFSKCVNQRSVSGTITTPGYFYDRWILIKGQVTISDTDSFINIPAGSEIEQRIDTTDLAGDTYTFSYVNFTGAIRKATGVFPDTPGTENTYLVTGPGTGYSDSVVFGLTNNYAYIRHSGASSIRKYKCEKGGNSTLHLDPPVDYAVELPKCQRFFVELGATPQIFGYITNSTTGNGTLVLYQRMRVSPTLSHTAAVIYINGNSYNVTLSLIGTRGNRLNFTVTGASLPVAAPFVGYIGSPAGETATLSADL